MTCVQSVSHGKERSGTVSMPEMSLCNSQSDHHDAEAVGKSQEDVPETDLLSMEDGVKKRSSSTEDATEPTDGGSYSVTWTVSTALAVWRGEESDVRGAPEKAKKTNKNPSPFPVKARKAQSCYHIEYELPGETEAVKVDIVLFGPVAKLYEENKFKGILNTWNEGELTWLGWIQNFNIRVNRDTLISLLSRKIKLQIRNNKDILSNQARYDKLTSSRLPQDRPGHATDMCGGIKTMVNNLRTLCERKSNTFKKTKSDILLNVNSGVGPEKVNNLPRLTEAEFQKPSDVAFKLEDINKNATASINISPICFLAGETSLTERFPVCSSGVFEVMCRISLDRPLISDQLKADLNPLVITIVSATSMPSAAVPFHILQEKCEPVYCQYKFHNLSVHRTNSHKHGANIYFGDVNVILTGLMCPEELKEFLAGPPVEIEVHDRDRKLEETSKSQKQMTAVINSHGIASLKLFELLLGKKCLKAFLPIKSCPPTPPLDRERSTQNSDMTDAVPIPQGHYLEAKSELKVKVEIACPLNIKNSNCESGSLNGPFGRIIYLFDYNNFSVMTKLRSEIHRINTSALHMGSYSLGNVGKALSNYKIKHDESKDLDIVTGFHVLDKRTHIFVLEGLKHKAVKRLWEAVPRNLSGSEKEQVMVLYSSHLGFFKRIYDSLDAGLSPIHLYESLQTIMRQPRIYIRGTIPQPCFQALSRLSQICQVRQLENVVRNNLFPSADMVLSMSETYGTDTEQWEQKAGADSEKDMLSAPVQHTSRLSDRHEQQQLKWEQTVGADTDNPSVCVQMKEDAPLDAHKEECKKQLPFKKCKVFIQDNIQKVQEQSEHSKKPKAAVLRMELPADRPVHSYSIQTFNSRELLCKEMAKIPGPRFTCSQQCHSVTVEPEDRPYVNDHSSAPGTTGWVISTRSDKSKVHPEHPDEARVEELKKPWRENILHGNILKPTLSRDRWASNRRHEDFQLYSKPDPFFHQPPVTIYLAGDSLRQEQLEAATAQYSRFRKKLLPGSLTNPPSSGPLPQFKCHMGRNSDRIQDILKDEPKKLSLKKPGMKLKPLPQLSVMNLGDDKAEGKALAPGPCMNCNLNSKNTIPRHTSLYNKYHYTEFTKQHLFLFKRTALPLTDEEKRIFTFSKERMKTHPSAV